MKASDWIADFLVTNGVTDTFGLPGVVILELVYAMERRKPELTPHLTYHEQGAALAACGYARATGKLGVAYATRGPGLTNMITGIAEAYYDSLPVIFFTAHNSITDNTQMRVENNQEIDTVALVEPITKYAARIDDVNALQDAVYQAYNAAMSGRRGPVFLDIHSAVLKQEVLQTAFEEQRNPATAEENVQEIVAALAHAKRPVFLIGSGVSQSGTQNTVQQLAEQAQIPVLSSRTAQDVMPMSPMYFGHVGIHATRYSNFILSKADVIVAFGNRMAFPVKSKSFRPIVENAVIYRVDVDEAEFLRDIPACHNVKGDLRTFIPKLLKETLSYDGKEEWLEVCRTLKKTLWKWDETDVTRLLGAIICSVGKDSPVVCDVGNHGFWVTTAYAYAGASNQMIYSGSFGTLGSALPKAIGACCGAKAPVLCFAGDQGIQMNIQELQLIKQLNLPIIVVVLNNRSSGMIREREKSGFGDKYLHTTLDSGYGIPDFRTLAQAYGLAYSCVDAYTQADTFAVIRDGQPRLIEVCIDEDEALYPNLPQGNACQNLIPLLPEELYEQMNSL